MYPHSSTSLKPSLKITKGTYNYLKQAIQALYNNFKQKSLKFLLTNKNDSKKMISNE